MENKNWLIYAEDLLLAIRDDLEINGKNFAMMKKHIYEATVVDAVEVVHGRWINQHWRNVCSECRYIVGQHSQSKYCPNCGAKMDGDM